MRAAQDAPLAEMLTAYRVGVAEIWDTLVATARGLPDVPADAVIDLAGTVFAVQNTYSDAALAAYRDESRQILRTRERERAAMVEAILTGGPARGTLWEVANALRLPVDSAFLVVAAETEVGHDPMPRAESALAVLDVRSVWRLDAEQLSLSPPSAPGASCRTPDKTRTGTVVAAGPRPSRGPAPPGQARPPRLRRNAAAPAGRSVLSLRRRPSIPSRRGGQAGAGTRPRSPRRDPCSRACRSRPSAPWSRRTGRRR
jgi:hypothetical protein